MSRLAGRLLRAPGAWPLQLLLAALVLPRATFLGEALFDRDLHADWYPRAAVLARTVLQGLAPLWDLSIGFGQPLLGDPSAQALYPTTWLLLLLPPAAVYTIFAVAHLAFSGAGLACLARAGGLRRHEAALAGAAWSLCGPFVSLVNLWHHFAGAAWIPWVVLAVQRVVRRPSARSAAWLALCLGLQVLAGSADMLLLTAGLAAVWLVALGAWPCRGRLARAAGAGVAGVALAAALSAGQWLPALELAARGSRTELSEGQLQRWSVPPAGLLRTIVPLDASGRLAFSGPARRALFDSDRQPFLYSLFAGSVAAALACGALVCRRRRRAARVLALAAVLAALVALGGHTPVHGLALRLVPGASHLRYPSKVMVAFGFCVALLAGLGLAAVRRDPAARRVAGVAAAVLAAVFLAAAPWFGPAVRLAVDWGLLAARKGVEGDALPSALRLLGHGVLACLAAALLLRVRSGERPARRAAALTACLCGELLLAHHDLHATTPPALLRLVPPVLSAVDQRDHARAYVYEYWIEDGTSQRLLGRAAAYAVAQPAPGIDPRPLAALAMRLYPAPPVGGVWGLEGSYDLDLRGLQPLAQWGLTLSLRAAEGTPAHRALLRMAAVRTVVALHRKGFEDLQPGPAFASLFPEPILTFRLPDALPRARVVGRARALEGREALVALFDPAFDFASETTLSGPGASAAATAARGGHGDVRIAELRGGRVRLEAELDAPGFVVLADAWDPGWRARVDGRPAELFRANVVLRAVAVGAGRHVVEMSYRPASATIGLAASAFGLVAVVILLLPLRRAARRLAA